ncbi:MULTISPECIES: helix-turn-helix transcriptional regulator [Elizabethkingia]|nr:MULTISPECIES: helix-turn-helix transcriptional regulator [Elizabethkingia]AVF48118.1 AraC family transcriptional regulator [Elizabethkingia anophelis]AVF52112.1 AraC family transcriptional regulator [Elizabethkingia anophelis]ELB0069013.1 helix-turn-helix domain-containing protein [Elizabethkingia anophelis]ELB1894099.1 helix-turn-helix domain-containing protein [Elizabethkingia anophelis]MBG0505733.1 helix-turn-helix domain-containing protein [Elizabethkingia anophelis]
MKGTLLFCSLLCWFICKSQAIGLSEIEVEKRFNQIALKNLENENFKEVNTLYQYSVSKNYKTGILKGLIAIQQYYLGKGNYTKALNYGEKAKEKALKLDDNNALSNIYMYDGTTFAMLDMHKKSNTALNIAVQYAEKIDNTIDKNIQLSRIYTTFAGLSEGEELNDSIVYYSKKSLEFIESIPKGKLNKLQESNYYNMLISQYLNMGSIYTHFIKPPNFEKAEFYYSKALNLSTTQPEYFKENALFAYFTIGHFYFQKKEYQKSIMYFEKTLVEEKMNTDLNRRLATYDNLKNIYDSIKDVSKQNKYLKLYSNLNDSLLRIKNKSIITHSDKQTHHLQSEVSNLRKDILWSCLAATIILFSIGAYFYKRNSTLRIKYNVLINKLENQEVTATKRIYGNSNEVYVNSNIPLHKEDNIIKKIEAFENSEKFLRKNITLPYISHLLNINPRYLSITINKVKNKNFNDYINELRIKYIIDKLYNNPLYREYKISYLAEECGYSSHQVFITAFRKETGMTPSYFIKQLSIKQRIKD